ncbi:hypothetical protein [Flavobacterium sp.]
MSFKLLLLYIKTLALLLLFSPSALAKTVTLDKTKAKTELKSGNSIHKEHLHQQTYTIGVSSERTASIKVYGNLGFFIVDGYHHKYFQKDRLYLNKQDANRCESVSIHLFPYHFFW